MSINNNFMKTIISIQEAYANGTLYKKKLGVNGQLKKMSGLEKIGAIFNHFGQLVTFSSKDENNKSLIKLMNGVIDSKTSNFDSETVYDFTLRSITETAISTIKELYNKNTKETKLINKTLTNLELEFKKNLINSIQNELKNQNISENQKQDVIALIGDKDWTNITSLKPLKNLARKLQNPHSELSKEEFELMKQCLRLSPKVVKVEEAKKNKPELETYFDKFEFKAIQQINNIYLNHINSVRKLFNKECGSVETDWDEQLLLPTKEQFSIALKLAEKNIPIYMKNQKFGLQAVRLIMCDNSQFESARIGLLKLFPESIANRLEDIFSRDFILTMDPSETYRIQNQLRKIQNDCKEASYKKIGDIINQSLTLETSDFRSDLRTLNANLIEQGIIETEMKPVDQKRKKA